MNTTCLVSLFLLSMSSSLSTLLLLHPGKLTWNPNMVGLEDDFLFNLVIFRFLSC